MDEKVQQAQEEIKSAAAPGASTPPQSLEEVVAGLKGFGIEELEEILTIKSGKGPEVKLRLANVPTTDEMLAVQAADDLKGYLWIKRVKVELLSRSISWVGLGPGTGISIRDLPADKRFVPDPTDKGQVKDVQIVLRNLILGWGQEVSEILWKVLMTHSQNIENRLSEQFPESAVMTDVERRLFEQARQQIDEETKIIVQDQVAKLYDAELDGSLPVAEEKSQ